MNSSIVYLVLRNDTLKTREVKFKFDMNTKLNDMKKFVLRNYAIEFLKYTGEINPNKFYKINSYFGQTHGQLG